MWRKRCYMIWTARDPISTAQGGRQEGRGSRKWSTTGHSQLGLCMPTRSMNSVRRALDIYHFSFSFWLCSFHTLLVPITWPNLPFSACRPLPQAEPKFFTEIDMSVKERLHLKEDTKLELPEGMFSSFRESSPTEWGREGGEIQLT